PLDWRERLRPLSSVRVDHRRVVPISELRARRAGRLDPPIELRHVRHSRPLVRPSMRQTGAVHVRNRLTIEWPGLQRIQIADFNTERGLAQIRLCSTLTRLDSSEGGIHAGREDRRTEGEDNWYARSTRERCGDFVSGTGPRAWHRVQGDRDVPIIDDTG